VYLTRLVYLAADLEIFIFAVAFFIEVGILSIKTACFFITTALNHCFPEWRGFVGGVGHRLLRSKASG
jgi:glycerol-3-phosphate acyltransferase PlsY